MSAFARRIDFLAHSRICAVLLCGNGLRRPFRNLCAAVRAMAARDGLTAGLVADGDRDDACVVDDAEIERDADCAELGGDASE